MSFFVQLDFKSRIQPDLLSSDFRVATFSAELTNGGQKMLKVDIQETEHEILKNVYNLAFGPLNKAGKIDHYAELEYAEYTTVFSTILYNAYRYLLEHPGRMIGIDGSTNSRAYLYYRYILKNI